jgi:mono/diheme cytochrome c family protein
MRRRNRLVFWAGVVVAVSIIAIGATHVVSAFARPAATVVVTRPMAPWDVAVARAAQQMMDDGRNTFRYATFGDEAFWSDGLGLDKALEGTAHGGVGGGISPKTALSLGLKVDMDALPASVVDAIKAGKVDLNDPATTLTLIKLKAVLGVVGTFDGDRMTKVGLTCAVCHSTVDDAFAPGIGHRQDGFGNRDLNPGAIIAAMPNVSLIANLLKVDVATAKKVLGSWGPGRFDAELDKDGKAMRPDGKQAGTIIPNAFGLAGVNNHTWTGGWGDVTYWNAYVANTEMHGKGTFYDRRLSDAKKYPVSARTGEWKIRNSPDQVTPLLGALQVYQLSIPAPPPPAGSFDVAAAGRGERVFNGKGTCATCHVPPLFTEPGWNNHTAKEMGIDDFQAARSPDHSYRTTPLKGLWTYDKSNGHGAAGPGYYHDGRFKDLAAVIEHYDAHFKLRLTAAEKHDLIEYLKSL